jgi:hypothetical protein
MLTAQQALRGNTAELNGFILNAGKLAYRIGRPRSSTVRRVE